MKDRTLRVIMNGVTGRMGTNQHLARSVLAIRNQGGVTLRDGSRVVPEPVLVGRDERKLAQLAARHSVERYTTDLDAALSDPANDIYFDSQTTAQRTLGVTKAIAAGKAVYCEKPTATTTAGALELYRLARAAGVKHGVVQDKLWLPGLRKLKYLVDTGFFGEILSVRGGVRLLGFRRLRAALPAAFVELPQGGWRRHHDRHVLPLALRDRQYFRRDRLALRPFGATHIGRRLDEKGAEYACTAEDAAFGTFALKNGVICQFNSSWAVRVRRDDLLVLQVDGTKGSAVAGLRECHVQGEAMTPKPVWNPDIPSPIDYHENWAKMPARDEPDNAFKAQWEKFLLHVAQDDPFPWDLLAGAKGVQLAELGLLSWKERRWVDVPELER